MMKKKYFSKTRALDKSSARPSTYFKKISALEVKKSTRTFDDMRAKEIFRSQNLAARMDLGHTKGEAKKKKS